MPVWIIQLLISLAVKFGLPFVLRLIAKKFPGVPTELGSIIEELLKNLGKAKEDKKEAVRTAKLRVAECYGPTCNV